MIKQLIIAMACLGVTGAPTAFAESSDVTIAKPASETVIAKVNGMVCDFCAQVVTKVFKKTDKVDRVDVNLDDGLITVDMMPGETLDDATVEKLVRDSGYALVSIERVPSA